MLTFKQRLRDAWRTRLDVKALVILVGITGVVAIADPALASYSACPANSICVYTASNGTGTVCIFNASTVNTNNGQSLAGTSCNNNVDSVYVHTGLTVLWFDGAHCALPTFYSTDPETHENIPANKLSSLQMQPDSGTAC